MSKTTITPGTDENTKTKTPQRETPEHFEKELPGHEIINEEEEEDETTNEQEETENAEEEETEKVKGPVSEQNRKTGI